MDLAKSMSKYPITCYRHLAAYRPHLLEKISGPEMTMYSGKRKCTQSFGDYRDLEVKTKYSMICVKAQGNSRGHKFWVAKVTDILTHLEDVPEKIKIIWFAVEPDENAMEGRYNPEKSKSSRRFLEDEIYLSQTTVYAYNFSLLGNKTLPAQMRRIVEAALKEET